MRKVTLVFPDTSSLAEFILKYSVEKAEVNSREQEMTAELKEEDIAIACVAFGAIIQPNPSMSQSV